jgi:uncharacterized protein
MRVAATPVAEENGIDAATFFESTDEALLVPDLVIPEFAYLITAGAQTDAEAGFLRSLSGGRLKVEHATDADLGRAAELVDTYADLRLGTVDAVVVAISERLDVREIATLDRRHFAVVRPRHLDAFTLFP